VPHYSLNGSTYKKAAGRRRWAAGQISAVRAINQERASPAATAKSPIRRRANFGKGKRMSKIYHIAVKVPDIDKAKAFYKNLFGFEELKQSKVRDHTSCHLTDGVIDLAIIQYDSEDSPEAGLSGDGPCIHHFGVEVDDLETSNSQLKEMGCEILSKPGVLPIKFRSPFGVVAEISPTGYFDSKHKNG
jgi:catechol 2,3-dioxygenase-like lactoylglutathione lyase family enzyme